MCLFFKACCVHFTNPVPACEIKVLLLLYTSEKRTFLGFIPNDQTAFVDRLRKVIQHQKSTQMIKHIQVRRVVNFQGGGVLLFMIYCNIDLQGGGGPSNPMPSGMPTTSISQGGILMSQTNTVAMGGGQITQNVVNSNNQQQSLTANPGQQGQINLQVRIRSQVRKKEFSEIISSEKVTKIT